MDNDLVSAFLSLSPQEQKQFIQTSQTKFDYTFERLYSLWLNTVNGSDKEYIMPDIHRKWLGHFKEKSRFVLVLAPRGFSKSTTMRLFALDEILSRRERYVIYVSSNNKKAKDQFAGVAEVLSQQVLQDAKGYQITKSNDREIEIRFHKDGSTSKLEAIGQGADILGINFKGVRPGLILIDDLEELDQARSIQRTNELQSWMFTTLIPTLPSLSKGRVRMIGTVLTRNAIANRIKNNIENAEGEKQFSDWNCYTYTALENGKSIWEEMHSTKTLQTEQEIRPRSFAANYMNEPMDESTSLISRDMLKFYKMETFDFAQIERSYAHFDLNVETRDDSDYFAGILLAKAKDGKMYILDIVRTHADVEQQAKTIISFWQQWRHLAKLKKVTIDGIAYQRTLKHWTDMEARRQGVYMNLVPRVYSKDKKLHFAAHEPLFTSQSVYLPEDHPLLHHLLTELLSFPDGVHDDLIDAFCFSADNFLNLVQGFKQNIKRAIVTHL